MDDFVPRFARPEDRPALSRLWLACFPGDTMETVRAVFGRLALETECLVAAPDGFPVSMLLLLPQRYAAAGRSLPVQYIYAAATLPAYRGRGYCGALLKAAFEVGRSRGQAASFLRPASQGLTDYYSSATGLSSVSWRGGSLSLTRLCACPDWNSFPCGTTGPRGKGFSRTGRLISFGKNGGRIWRWSRPRRPAAEVFPLPGPLGARSANPTGTRCLSGSFSAPPLRQSALLSRFGRTGIVCRTPVRAAEGEGTVFGLWRPLDDDGWEQLRPAAGDKPYMGLALD